MGAVGAPRTQFLFCLLSVTLHLLNTAAASCFRMGVLLPTSCSVRAHTRHALTMTLTHTLTYTHRRGSVEPFTVIDGPEAWTAAEYAGRNDWIDVLSPAHIAELDAAVSGIERRGITEIQKITREDFPLPTLGPYLESIRDQVVTGRGFALIRGMPVERYSRRQTMVAYWGLGLYWGNAASNNSKGHMIGHIKVRSVCKCVRFFGCGCRCATTVSVLYYTTLHYISRSPPPPLPSVPTKLCHTRHLLVR